MTKRLRPRSPRRGQSSSKWRIVNCFLQNSCFIWQVPGDQAAQERKVQPGVALEGEQQGDHSIRVLARRVARGGGVR